MEVAWKASSTAPNIIRSTDWHLHEVDIIDFWQSFVFSSYLVSWAHSYQSVFVCLFVLVPSAPISASMCRHAHYHNQCHEKHDYRHPPPPPAPNQIVDSPVESHSSAFVTSKLLSLVQLVLLLTVPAPCAAEAWFTRENNIRLWLEMYIQSSLLRNELLLCWVACFNSDFFWGGECGVGGGGTFRLVMYEWNS